jgi:membrane protease subunit (stomatin/prohibitin family)
MDTFPSGEYTLNTKSLPLVGNTAKMPTDAGFDAVFHSEVYFVNLVTHLGYKWGTPSRIRLIDPITSMHIDIGARGSMNIRISDARKLLVKLVGTGSTLTREDLQSDSASGKSQQSALSSFFRDMIVARVRTHLSKSIKNEKIDLMEIDERLEDLSESLQSLINENLEEYGFALENFLITDVDLPVDNEAYLKLKKLHDERILKVSEKTAERDYVQADAEIAYAKKAQEQTLNIMTASNEAQVARINVEKAKAEADAIIARAQAEAEKTRLSGAASADAYAAQARAEAEEMHSKGYTYQQETSRQIGIEAMQNGLPGTGASASAVGGTVNSAIGDMIGVGMTLGAVGSVMEMAKDTMAPIVQDVSQMGKQFNSASPAAGGWNCECGKAGITSKFCPECGRPMPVSNSTWNCSCGCSNISSKFCPDCGQKRPSDETWECKNCQTKGIKSKFCPNCGHAKEA